jgi:hypothetical protein
MLPVGTGVVALGRHTCTGGAANSGCGRLHLAHCSCCDGRLNRGRKVINWRMHWLSCCGFLRRILVPSCRRGYRLRRWLTHKPSWQHCVRRPLPCSTSGCRCTALSEPSAFGVCVVGGCLHIRLGGNSSSNPGVWMARELRMWSYIWLRCTTCARMRGCAGSLVPPWLHPLLVPFSHAIPPNLYT